MRGITASWARERWPPTASQPLTVPGFAELHHHMVAEEAFGGGWFHGGHTGTLVSCDGGMPESVLIAVARPGAGA